MEYNTRSFSRPHASSDATARSRVIVGHHGKPDMQLGSIGIQELCLSLTGSGRLLDGTGRALAG